MEVKGEEMPGHIWSRMREGGASLHDAWVGEGLGLKGSFHLLIPKRLSRDRSPVLSGAPHRMRGVEVTAILYMLRGREDLEGYRPYPYALLGGLVRAPGGFL
jgi:hypothetical protein